MGVGTLLPFQRWAFSSWPQTPAPEEEGAPVSVASVVTVMACASGASLGALAPVTAAGRAGCASPREPAAGVEPPARAAGFPGSAPQERPP